MNVRIVNILGNSFGMKMKTEKEETSKKLNSVLIGIGIAVFSYITFGSITSIIKNPFFTRMTPVGWLEQTSLATTSSLLGIYIGLVYYGKSAKKDKICNTTATAGGIFGFLTFGCSICNKILVFFLGIMGVFTYFEPLRPILGTLSIIMLSGSVFYRAKGLKIK